MSFNGVIYDTFREAAMHRGFLQSNDYVDNCLAEAALFQMPYYLRTLFALLLVYEIAGDPQQLCDKYYPFMCEDFLCSGLLTSNQVVFETISTVQIVLASMDTSIFDFPIKFPSASIRFAERLSRDYLYVLSIFDLIVQKIVAQESGAFFLDGLGGTGKTFLYRALLAYVRRNIGIALVVATFGVALSLLPGGRTAHSRFKLPLDVDDKSTGYISKQSGLAKMIIECRLIIWDEDSMANRHSIETLDATLRDLCDPDLIFGGKIILFGGDFRQTLPIIVRGSRNAAIDASLVKSMLWQNITKLKLVTNMRAREDAPFIEFLLRIGEGREPNVYEDSIEIPRSMLIPFVDPITSLDDLIQFVYPSFDYLPVDSFLSINRATLTPKNDCVSEINDFLIDRFLGQLKEYIGFDTTNDVTQQAQYEDYLNTVSVSGLPLNVLRLKENCPIMLLRNLNLVQGLSNALVGLKK